MKRNQTVFALFAMTIAASALAKEPEIASNSSSINQPLLNSIAASAIGAGAKEPLDISQNGNQVIVQGSNGTACRIKISEGNPPKMLGVSCK